MTIETPTAKEKPAYTGRFAPSPSGLLHFGSLVAALASYLDARSQNGTWLVRMEDIDPPREQPGAADQILKSLEAYGLHWDGQVLYQSQRTDAYRHIINDLQTRGYVYPCTCTRRELQGYGGLYPGICRNKSDNTTTPHSLRVKCSQDIIEFQDLIQGAIHYALPDLGDFIIQRKDGLFAYQLAVCADDADQGITHIVRGYDLLNATPWQIYLLSLLDTAIPVYAHFPVITLENGDKLSKQNHAAEIPLDQPEQQLIKALQALGQKPDTALEGSSVAEILEWGTEHWQIDNVANQPSVSLLSLRK
ncbi:tRNA glutamyl-Q(34) synthetase GluQRS [Endozoicomonas numazuensis]|uniref:Glutamyl-Q tRNA(Asp) synthetase n=1 Tax=Endozoicomonas numazuensis TaxID=1137799 RepID=A0A081ND97_9GAMM|nr:tRNA glutamyl-Q(34) synthetase GluQRS [Endozoicomonas numazuensis]KEQ16420.1 glutamyl-Q tRNA(Asp) ligase [Endozoicomonas numazuensis]